MRNGLIKKTVSLLLVFIMISITVFCAEADEIVYLPGNKNKQEDIPVFEEFEGSFMMEAEDGLVSAPFEVFDDQPDNTSEGKYLDAHGSTPWDAVPVKYQFYVSKKGKYRLVVRRQGIANQNSTWFWMDNETEKNRYEPSATSSWGWYVDNARNNHWYLDEGWHILNMQARKPDHKIDRILLTLDPKYVPTGFGLCPGEKGFDKSEAKILKILANGNRVAYIAAKAHFENDVPMGSGEAVFSMLGFDVRRDESSMTFINGRNYVKVFDGTRKAIYNNKQFYLPEKSYIDEDSMVVAYIPIAEKLGAEHSFDDVNIASYLTYSKYKNAELIKEEESEIFSYKAQSGNELPEAEEGKIKIDLHYECLSYEIPYDDKNAACVVEVSNPGVISSWGQRQPEYRNGAFVGMFSALHEFEKDYELRVWIYKDGKLADSFKRSFKTSKRANETWKDIVPDAEKLTLTSTFENIGFYINAPEKTECKVSYREKGGEWKDAYTPFYDNRSFQFRGSIVGLKENTEYEVKAELSGAVSDSRTAEISTWAEDVPIAKTISVKDIYKGGPILLHKLNGTPDGWIKIVGDGETVIDGGMNETEAIMVSDCSYIIFDNLLIKGGKRHGINVTNASHDIRIQNTEIWGWARKGNFNVLDGAFYDQTGTIINNDAAVRISDVSNVVVERCYFHDPRGHSNAWRGPTWLSTHPNGPNAIRYRGISGVVIRYNDFIGSNLHRWNDAIESYYNGNDTGGAGSDADVYGNILAYGQDDGIELDGGAMNNRFYQNRVDGFYCGISVAPTNIGPIYVFRNVWSGLNDEAGRHTVAFKANNSVKNEFGMRYYFHNVVDGTKAALQPTEEDDFGYSRNNIFVVTGDEYSYMEVLGWRDYSSFDYDLFGNYNRKGGAGQPIKKDDFTELNAVLGLPSYVDRIGADFRLTSESLGIDKGEYLANFSDGFTGSGPDMGAFETGTDEWSFSPYRPVQMKSDKYRLYFDKTNNTAEVKITLGDIGEGHTYKLRINEAFPFISVENEEGKDFGEAKPNSEIILNVKYDASKMRLENDVAAFTFRLDNGFSIPVTIEASGGTASK